MRVLAHEKLLFFLGICYTYLFLGSESYTSSKVPNLSYLEPFWSAMEVYCTPLRMKVNLSPSLTPSRTELDIDLQLCSPFVIPWDSTLLRLPHFSWTLKVQVWTTYSPARIHSPSFVATISCRFLSARSFSSTVILLLGIMKVHNSNPRITRSGFVGIVLIPPIVYFYVLYIHY